MSSDLLTGTVPPAPTVDAPSPRDDTYRATADATRAAPASPPTTERATHRATAPAVRIAPEVRLDIEVDNEGLVMVKVRDAKTDKVVREIPPEDLVEFGRKMRQMTGVLVDRTA